jgi:hypothetical protein
MCTPLMVIGEVASQDVAEVSLAENEHVIQTLAPDRTDEPLREGVLPRAVRCRKPDPRAGPSTRGSVAAAIVGRCRARR